MHHSTCVTHVPWSWWRHEMETFSALLAICAGNSPVSGEFPAQRPVARSFDIFFDLRLNQRLSKQSWGWWFETLSRPLWRHCNMHVGITDPRWRGKRSRHSRCMGNPRFYVSGKRPMETHSPPGKGRQEEPRGKRSGTKLSIHGTPFIAWNMFTMAHVLSNILRSSQALSFIWHYNFCCCSNSLCICTPKNQDFLAPDDHLLKSWFNFNSNMDK